MDGRCFVYPAEPLPNLSNGNARAFRATDAKDRTQQLYALLLDPQVPFRLPVVMNARDLNDSSVVKPAYWGSVDWPESGRRETLLVLQRPPEDPLMPTIDARVRAFRVQEIINQLMKPMAALLLALTEKRITHRNIRPTNLFRTGNDGPIFAGEFYSAPPGFNQPAMFEPIERAMCAPSCRGTGDVADDLFALGVTALFLSTGRNPVAGVDPEELLTRRAEMGSYAALTLEHKPPPDLATPIRSLLHDNPRDRWTMEDLARWVDLSVAVQARPNVVIRSDRAFEFAEGSYHTRRELALAFSRNWDSARAVVLTDAVERWAERSVKDRELTQQIAECRISGSQGPRMISDDLLLARTIITLDPDGPLRYRGLAVMPDGLGPAAALATNDPGMGSKYSELITSQLTDFWFQRQQRPSSWASMARSDAEKMRNYLGKSGPGFGIERCAYELNRGWACQSPRLAGANAVQIRDMMEALDAGAQRGEQQLDRHVAAFLGARYSGSIDHELAEFGGARTGEDAMIAQLRVFAAVQFKHGPPALPNLIAAFYDHLDILLAPFHNTNLRKRLRQAIEQVVPDGKLPELLSIVRNKSYLQFDRKGFDQARRRYRWLERQRSAEAIALERAAERAIPVGRKAAAYIACCICATVVVVSILAGLH